MLIIIKIFVQRQEKKNDNDSFSITGDFYDQQKKGKDQKKKEQDTKKTKNAKEQKK